MSTTYPLCDHLRNLLTQDSSQTTPKPLGGLGHAAFSTLMQRRQLLPAETIVSIVDSFLKMTSSKASASGIDNPIILVDGFPRTHESAVLADVRWGAPSSVLFFDCPRELAEARFLKRRRSADDSVEIFRMRYDEFERLNGAIMQMYSDIIFRVDTTTGMGETWDGLHDKVGQLMEQLGGTKSGISHET
ncbi:hypothetical protein Q7P35_003929 [Cladosporium inversicolor]